MSGSLSSDDSTGPAVPRGVLEGKRGWRGEELEFSRQSTGTKSENAAVDLQQFRNEEVGKGYQAKHVVRQRSAKDPDIAIHDMTKKSKKKSKKQRRESSKRDHVEQYEKRLKIEKNASRLERYLKCDGMRKFRKEIAEIEAEP